MSKSNYTCDNCGAEILFNGNLMFKECSYCGNLIALLDNSVIDIGAKEAIPFDITSEEAYFMYHIQQIVNYGDVNLAEKVYIPFYLCKFNFSYLAKCRKVTGSGDDKRIEYYTLFIDGMEDSCLEFAFNEKIFLHGRKYINKDKLQSIDSLNAGDYTVLEGKFANSEKFIDKAANDLGDYYATEGFKSYISLCDTECAEYGKEIKIVLVPFYKIKAVNGGYIYVLGQRKTKLEKSTSSLYNVEFLKHVLFLFVCLFSCIFMHKHLFVVIGMWIIMIVWLLISNIFKKNNYMNKNVRIKKMRRH